MRHPDYNSACHCELLFTATGTCFPVMCVAHLGCPATNRWCLLRVRIQILCHPGHKQGLSPQTGPEEEGRPVKSSLQHYTSIRETGDGSLSPFWKNHPRGRFRPNPLVISLNLFYTYTTLKERRFVRRGVPMRF